MSFDKTKRVQKELQRLQTSIDEAKGSENFLQKERWLVEPGTSLDTWECVLLGPVDTPYENQRLPVRVTIKNVDYPQKPPTVAFSKIVPFHANIFKDGNICLDILKEDLNISKWTPAMKIQDVLASLVSMLNEPNTDSPANVDAARAYDNDKTAGKKEFARLAQREYERQLNK